MSPIVRAGMTETVNAFEGMPDAVGELDGLADRMEEIRAANVDHHLELIAAAAESGVQVLGLGELFPAPYFALERRPMWRALAEDATRGPTATALCSAAREHGLILVAPIYELCAESGKRFNTALVIDEEGTLIGIYRKAHVPEGRNEQGQFHESFYYARSNGRLGTWPRNVSKNPYFPVFETAVGRIGVATCYDRHFPSMQTLAHEGAELVFSPAVTFGAKSHRMWPLEFAVDAARHGLFIAGSNRRGAERPWNQEFFGESHFAGPSGVVEPLPSTPNLVIADLDLDELARPDSSGWDLRRDRRPDIYSA